MPLAVRLPATSNHGGTVIPQGPRTMKIDGGFVVLDGDLLDCGNNTHGTTSITGTGFPVDGRNLVLEGDLAGCGAAIENDASSSVEVG